MHEWSQGIYLPYTSLGALVVFEPSYNSLLSTPPYLYSLTHNSQDGKFAMGFSGDVEGGGKTAYDVLPPKPWKAAP